MGASLITKGIDLLKASVYALNVALMGTGTAGASATLGLKMMWQVSKVAAVQMYATAVAVVLPLCLISAVIYIVKGCFDIQLTLYVGGGVVLGGIAGALLLKKADNFWLSIFFYAVMIGAGVKMTVGR